MESWPEQENWVQMVLPAQLAEATQLLELPAKRIQRERALKASQLAEPRQVSAKRPEPLKWQGLEIALAA
jgi:hypothetical protein